MNLDTCTPGQRRIIETLDKPLMVSAGAGSGKTFTLTQRIAFALSEPLSSNPTGGSFASSVDQILAITFTKKAAAELKSRIKGKLLELGLTTEALKVDDAWISTIHGMCSRILREHALELGIDPTFEVISETAANRLKELAFDQVIFEINQSSDTSLKQYIHSIGIFSYGGNSSSIQGYVDSLSNKALALPGGFDSLDIPAVEGNPAELLREMIEIGQEFIAVSSALQKPTKTDAKHLQACESAVDRAIAFLESGVATSFSDESFDAESYASVLFDFPKTSPKYRVKESDPTFFEDYRQTYARIACCVEAALSAKELELITQISKKVYRAFQDLKGPRRLDNTDLLRNAYRALRDNPQLAQSYQDQFRMIMIDEFQDTDELQVALLSLIAKSGFSNVCTVGDAQQSIYRFRGADVSVFYSYREMLEEKTVEPEFVSLPDNFRSHADVLSFVDKVFSQPQVFGSRFLSLLPKGSVNKEKDSLFDARSRIEVSLFDCPSSGSGIAGGRVACARRIAQHFAELYDAGASPSDMTLLLGSMSNVGVYSQALRDVGFQCLVSGGSTFSASYEVGLIKAILRFFARLLDDEALYEILSSPLFSIDDEVLLFLVTRYDREGKPHRRSLSEGFLAWNGDQVGTSLSDDEVDALDFARDILEAARKTMASCGLAAGVQELLRASGWYIRLDNDSSAEAQAQVGNIYKALRMIESSEKLGLGVERTVQRFIDDCETLKLSPGTLSTSSSDFIEIMTIHSSKGLEFPHVAVAELRLDSVSESLLAENVQGTTRGFVKPYALSAVRPMMKALKDYLEAPEGSVEEVQSASYEDLPRMLEALHNAQELSEARRLLYVALTRASKSLFLGIAYRGKKEPDYTGKGVLEDLYSALQWDPCASAPIQALEYGGSAPLMLEFQVVDDSFEMNHPLQSYYSLGEYQEAFEQTKNQDDLKEVFYAQNQGLEHLTPQQGRLLRIKSLSGGSITEKNTFDIPGFPPPASIFSVPLMKKHDEVCSYSSLGTKDSSFRLEQNELSDQEQDDLSEQKQDDLTDQNQNSGMFDQVSHDFLSLSEKADATALGDAFHRLAQRAIDSSSAYTLEAPDADSIAAQVSLHSLTLKQQSRLENALKIWLGSDCAQKFASHEYRYAEIPFMVTFGPESNLYLEGEIDGLACDFLIEEVTDQPLDKRIAYLIDYKTGGSPLETEADLKEKHLLQAQCYAYALLKDGFGHVNANFVRVEQNDPFNPGQPQIVTYEFGLDQLSSLEKIIYQAYLGRTAD